MVNVVLNYIYNKTYLSSRFRTVHVFSIRLSAVWKCASDTPSGLKLEQFVTRRLWLFHPLLFGMLLHSVFLTSFTVLFFFFISTISAFSFFLQLQRPKAQQGVCELEYEGGRHGDVWICRIVLEENRTPKRVFVCVCVWMRVCSAAPLTL